MEAVERVLGRSVLAEGVVGFGVREAAKFCNDGGVKSGVFALFDKVVSGDKKLNMSSGVCHVFCLCKNSLRSSWGSFSKAERVQASMMES